MESSENNLNLSAKNRNKVNKNNAIPKRWLITGGCGFIGVNLIERLLRDDPGAAIRVLDNLSAGSREDLARVCRFKEVPPSAAASAVAAASATPAASAVASASAAASAGACSFPAAGSSPGFSPGGVELMVGDIRNPAATECACRGVDTIVHLAANAGVASSMENPRYDCEVNVLGTFNLLEAARLNKVPRFVFASSGAPLGEQEPPIHEEKVPRPVSPYGAGKLAGEAYCSAYCRAYGIKTIALRFGNVYGPRSKHKSSVVAKFIRRALAGEPLEIYGDGNQTRDFVYIRDLVEAIVLAAKSNLGGEIFQIATYRETTVQELTDQLVALLQHFLPDLRVTVAHGQKRPGDVVRNYSDITKARRLLGFEPRYDLEKGLKETISWYLNLQINHPEN